MESQIIRSIRELNHFKALLTNPISQRSGLFIGKRNLVNGIIPLLESDVQWSKVIPLSSVNCINIKPVRVSICLDVVSISTLLKVDLDSGENLDRFLKLILTVETSLDSSKNEVSTVQKTKSRHGLCTKILIFVEISIKTLDLDTFESRSRLSRKS